MEDCLDFLWPPPNRIKHFKGTSAVWQVGDLVYKYPTQISLDIFKREVATIKSLSLDFASEVKLVQAELVTASRDILKHAPRQAIRLSPEIQVIQMPLLLGKEAYDIVLQPGFPQMAVAAAALRHCRRLVELGYANCDIKLENIIISPANDVSFIDWGGICRLDELPSHSTYVVTDADALRAHDTMRVHLTMLIGEMGGLYLGRESPSGRGMTIQLQDVVLARVFCQKQLDSDLCALFTDFMGNFAMPT